MTAQERRARLDEVAEENAHRRLDEMEKAIQDAHFLEKHGKQTTLASQQERSLTGRNPTTGIIEVYTNGRRAGQPKIPSAATHFFSYRDQLNAIHRAQLIFRRNGQIASKEPMNMGKVVGEGYKRGGVIYGQQTHAVVVLNRAAEPITSYTEFVN
jgi:type II secretory pathway component PulJ